MCVVEKYQGKGAGEKLIDEALVKVHTLGVENFFLYTNRRLTAAFNLYKKKGFEIIDKPMAPTSNYKRDSIYMYFDLNYNCDEEK